MEKMRKQAARFGTRFVDNAISSVDFSSKPLRIRCSNSDNNIEEYFADSVIIATEASVYGLD